MEELEFPARPSVACSDPSCLSRIDCERHQDEPRMKRLYYLMSQEPQKSPITSSHICSSCSSPPVSPSCPLLSSRNGRNGCPSRAAATHVLWGFEWRRCVIQSNVCVCSQECGRGPGPRMW